MKKISLLITATLLATSMMMAIAPRTISAAPPPPRGDGEVDPALEQALQDKLAEYQPKVMGADKIGFTIDRIIPSADGQSSLLWLAPVDLETGEVIATEPALGVGVKDASAENGWQVVLSSDTEFIPSLSVFPQNLLPVEVQAEVYGEKSGLDSTLDATVYRGYKLPWAAGLRKGLSGSIGHFLIYNSCGIERCRYAYDFYDGTMFPLLAAKGGTIKTFYDGCYNGSTTCTNFLVIEDGSTSPVTWQIYYHMAQSSIPADLKRLGAPVLQGQFIGNVDDTGYSSGHHLHFHVTSGLYTYNNGYQNLPWGSSIDIRFDDVSVNDGTPRTCNEATRFPAYGTECADSYVSGNTGANPGTATLSAPANGSVVAGPSIQIAGTAADDRGVVKVQAVARNRGGSWMNLGNSTGDASFSIDAAICSVPLQNGLIDIGVVVTDLEGNNSVPQGVRSLVKNYGCTPPPPAACTPTADQITVYSEPNYTGACRKLGLSTSVYSNFDPVGMSDIASLQIGANVRAVASTAGMTYYTDYGNQQIITSGRVEGFEASDPNLKDNAIGSDTITSLIVQPRLARVSDDDVVTFPTLDTSPTANTVAFQTKDSLAVSFYEPGGTSFRVQLFREVSPGTFTVFQEYDNLPVPASGLGSLPPGKYRLWACGKAAVTGTSCSNNTPYYYFTVTTDGLPAQTAIAVPWTDSLDVNPAGWSVSGLWRWGDLSEGRKGFIYNASGSFNTGGTNFGSLTTPPISLPASGSPSLKFQYRYETESQYRFWDQRWVQVAVEGGQFKNVVQLTDDPMNFWLDSQSIDLSAYKGQTIRVRFFFFTADGVANSGTGWQIDQVSIGQNALQAICGDTNSSLATATPISVNQHITGQSICPAGDIDYFKFSGNKNQQLGIWVDASRDGSALDPVLALLDKNGSLVLENDDLVPYVVPDSNLVVILPETGDYYLKVKAWNHPGAGGENYPYSLHIFEDSTPPVISVTAPGSVWPTNLTFPFSVDGRDGSTRIMQMDFFWHPADWQGGTWTLIGSDYTGNDGWGVQVDPTKLGELKNSALYVEAKDAAGNVSGEIRITAQVDAIPPVVNINPLPGSMDTTAFQVTFSGSDDTQLQSLILESRANGSDWGGNGTIYGAGQFTEWYVGTPGTAVEFQAVAKDAAGNSNTAGATTQISGTCLQDSYESKDNTSSGATSLGIGVAQEHNFCQNDEDWFTFNAEAGKGYYITLGSLGGGAAFNLDVLAADGTTRLANSFSSDLGQPTALVWKPAATGKVYVKVTPVVPELAGTAVRYSIIINTPIFYYFPFVGK